MASEQEPLFSLAVTPRQLDWMEYAISDYIARWGEHFTGRPYMGEFGPNIAGIPVACANMAMTVVRKWLTIEHGVTQTIVSVEGHPTPGNCLQAAIATFFARPLEDVPHFALFKDWHQALNLWLTGEYGMRAKVRGTPDEVTERPEGLHLLMGPSPRGVAHVVVAKGHTTVWDPHPSRTGLVAERHVITFYKIEAGDE